MGTVHFFAEDVDYKLDNEQDTSLWITKVISDAQHQLNELSYIFCSDDYLLKVNQEYLDHDTFTDIITFDHSESEEEIAGDIFISVDRVKDNSITQGVTFVNELNRVMVHGVLHLLGYLDKTEEEKSEMRQMENTCLALLEVT